TLEGDTGDLFLACQRCKLIGAKRHNADGDRDRGEPRGAPQGDRAAKPAAVENGFCFKHGGCSIRMLLLALTATRRVALRQARVGKVQGANSRLPLCRAKVRRAADFTARLDCSK